jgi:hypothetical protein
MASEASQGCESVFAARPRIPDAQEQKPDKNENDEPHRPHPALSRKRVREKTSPFPQAGEGKARFTEKTDSPTRGREKHHNVLSSQGGIRKENKRSKK